MSRLDVRPVACTALAAAVLVYVGCSGDPAVKTEPAAGKPGNAATPEHSAATAKTDQTASPIEKLMAELNNPAAVLLVSGQQDGYLEPCGCSDEQSRRPASPLRVGRAPAQAKLAGFARRAGRPDQGPALPAADSNRTKSSSTMLSRRSSCSATTLWPSRPTTSRLASARRIGLFDNNLGEKTKIVVANVQPEQIYEKLFRRSIVVTAGPVKLGITAVIDPEAIQKLADPDKDVMLTAIKPPEEVLPGVLADLESKSDYQVLLVQGPPAMAKRLGEAYPGFDVVVATSELLDPLSREPEMIAGGKTMLITTGKKGKYVGVISIHPKEPTARCGFISSPSTADSMDPPRPMKALIEDEYRQTLEVCSESSRTSCGSTSSMPRPARPSPAQQTCKDCHPNTFDKWSKTKHQRRSKPS